MSDTETDRWLVIYDRLREVEAERDDLAAALDQVRALIRSHVRLGYDSVSIAVLLNVLDAPATGDGQ